MVELRAATVVSCLLLTLAGLGTGSAPTAVAADFSCRATVNRTTVPRGGNVILTVTAEGSVSLSAEFLLPEIPGVQVFRSGTNQSVSFVNGTTSTTISKTYYMRVESAADFTIPSIEVLSHGETCRTGEISIAVTAGKSAGGIPPAVTGNRTVPSDPLQSLDVPNGAGGRAGDDVFITLESDRQEAWVGQQIILHFK